MRNQIWPIPLTHIATMVLLWALPKQCLRRESKWKCLSGRPYQETALRMQGAETGKSKLKEYATNALLRQLRKKVGEMLDPSYLSQGIFCTQGHPQSMKSVFIFNFSTSHYLVWWSPILPNGKKFHTWYSHEIQMHKQSSQSRLFLTSLLERSTSHIRQKYK